VLAKKPDWYSNSDKKIRKNLLIFVIQQKIPNPIPELTHTNKRFKKSLIFVSQQKKFKVINLSQENPQYPVFQQRSRIHLRHFGASRFR
jgi:hypothetical protein